ncbi:hypothetical protein ACWDWO_13305 [Actinopolymorpha singaporensis]
MTAPAWSSAAATAWLSARSACWSDPRLSAVGWALIVALFVATDTSGACSEAAPCTIDRTDVVGAIVVVAALAHIGWLVWIPYVAWITTPVIVVVSAVSPGAIVGEAASWVLWLVVPAAAWTLATLWWQRSGRVRQFEAVAPLASALAVPPVSKWAWDRRTIRLLVGFAALAASAGLVAYTLHWQATEDAHVREATRVPGTVLAHLDDGYALKVRVSPPGSDVRTLETFDASGYPVGSPVHVLVDGSWARLAAEPFDPTGWYMLAAGAALVGATLVGTVLAWRRRLAVLASGPVPALTVWAGPAPDGLLTSDSPWVRRAVVYAADDENMRRPLLVVPVEAYDLHDDDRPDDDLPDDDLPEKDDEPGPAILFGLPGDGAVLALQVEGDEPLLLLPTGPARRAGRRHRGRAVGERRAPNADR